MDRLEAVANRGRLRRMSEATAPQLLVASQLISMADRLVAREPDSFLQPSLLHLVQSLLVTSYVTCVQPDQ
jgi:hypothetical protein